ncbi:HAD family hydrolase [Mesorhizobium sp. CAU 1741]|uniref:HAD family hydrolase n=1 Tax=Mesorhizobium sp. CAU 1741 TaxID=3140366 RepID=UPI00325B1CFB
MADIKGILFDKDGTLVDFHATWFAIGDMLALRVAGGDRERANHLLDIAGFDFEGHRFRPDSIFAAGTNAEIVALWYPQLGTAARNEVIAEFDRFTTQEGASKPVVLPGCKEALGDLHRAGFRLGVATNDSTGGAERTLAALGVAQLFEAAYGYDAVANPKPAPDTLYAFCDLTGLKPAQLAMVGDNRHDLEMARAGGAGLAVGVLSGTGTKETLEALADVVLDSIADLPAYLGAKG